jgi:hypothetical protein
MIVVGTWKKKEARRRETGVFGLEIKSSPASHFKWRLLRKVCLFSVLSFWGRGLSKAEI